MTDVVPEGPADRIRSPQRGICHSLAREAILAWHAAVARPLHGPGCRCCGSGPVKLDPKWLAEDVDFALRTRYAAAGLEGLVTLLDAHRLADGGDFATRIGTLADHAAHEQEDDAVRILRDVINILQTIGRSSTSRGPSP